MREKYDKIIIGAGMYGLYAALHCGEKKEKVVVLECDDRAFERATYVNQARVHQGYHYPRSISTAMKSAGYFERFNRDFDFCIHTQFEKVYATSREYSWTNGEQFVKFCEAAKIPCREVRAEEYFKENMCDGAFITREYTYDAALLRDYYMAKLEELPNVRIRFGRRVSAVCRLEDSYVCGTDAGEEYEAPFVLNAAYAGTNQIMELAGFEPFKIKYELCEIILCDAGEKLAKCGITVMDGPFFSIMPFGKTGLHSLTSVTFTPHATCHKELPRFACQERSGGKCSEHGLYNCNHCDARPDSAFPYMEKLAHKYLRDEYGFRYRSSLFSMKPILISSEIDDSRPTVLRVCSRRPSFVSVLSGKINTVYDLDEVLDDEP